MIQYTRAGKIKASVLERDKMRIEKTFVLREIAGDYVIVPTGKSALEFNGLITVNELGAFIWNQLQEETTVDQIVEAIQEEYEVDWETAKADTEEFLEVLIQQQILER